MKRKLLLGVLVFAVLGSSALYAREPGFGIGGEFALGALGGLPSSAMLTLKVQEIPVVLGIGMQLNENTFNLGLTADWWLFHQRLVGIIDMYAGPGLFLALPSRFMLGGRIPVGLQIWPLGNQLLELFLEIAPGITLIDDSGITVPNFILQAGFGFRFWF